MAGGMDPRYHERPPLAQRLGWNTPPAHKPRKAPRKPPYHCWVLDCPELPGRRPGLLLEWAKGEQGWRARVVLAGEGAQGPVMLTLWVASEHLRPTDSTDSPTDTTNA